MGIVEEVGSSVYEIKEYDRVVIPFNISCGKYWFCRHELWSQCDRSNPHGEVGAAYGYTQIMGGYDGGQAEFVRVSFANTGPLKIPDGISNDEIVLFLSDILPTGYFGADIADVQPGDDVAVFGASPVGYFAVMSSFLRGAARVFCVDHWESRFTKVRDLGGETINFDYYDPVEIIKKETNGRGAKCIDAVGYEAVGHTSIQKEIKSNKRKKLHDHSKVKNPAYELTASLQVIKWTCQTARKYSTISIPGVYGSEYDKFPLGQIFNKEIEIRLGQCHVKKYNEQLLHLIEVGRIDPTPLISNVMKLDKAPKGYEIFDKKEDVTKAILKKVYKGYNIIFDNVRTLLTYNMSFFPSQIVSNS